MMDVKSYNDEQLQSLLKDIHKELDQRKMERIKLAKEQIKKIATEVGIAVLFSDPKTPKRRTIKTQIVTHSDNPITTKESPTKTEKKELEEVMI